jgi:hypothetical protein
MLLKFRGITVAFAAVVALGAASIPISAAALVGRRPGVAQAGMTAVAMFGKKQLESIVAKADQAAWAVARLERVASSCPTQLCFFRRRREA